MAMNENGTAVVVGSPYYSSSGHTPLRSRGLVQVFEQKLDDNNEWSLREPSLLGDFEDNLFGFAVAMSVDGGTIAIGAPGHSYDRGQVKLFRRTGDEWTQIGQTLEGDSPKDKLGLSIDLSAKGNRVAITIPGSVRGVGGRARVFQYDGAVDEWHQLGEDLLGRVGESSLSMSSDGNIVALGAMAFQEDTGNSGVRVYEYIGGGSQADWSLLGSEIIVALPFLEKRKYDTTWSPSISSDGKTIAIGSGVPGAQGYGSGNDIEYHLVVKMFRYDDDSRVWFQLGSNQHDKKGKHLISYNAALSGDASVLVIGDPGGYARGFNSGHAHVLRLVEGEWVHIERELDGTDPGDRFGMSVSISSDGSRVACGAPKSRVFGSERGRVSVFEVQDLLDNSTFVN